VGSPGPDRAAAVGRMVTAHLPDARVGSVVQVGEGTDHLVYEVDGELIVRWSKQRDAAARAARVDREARLLAAVASISPLPVPEPTFTVPEQGCLAYRKLPGVPLLDLPRPQRSSHGASVAATLGRLLTALHGAPPGSTIPRPWGSGPPSMPGAGSSRTWRTASRPATSSTSTRATPR
jgi:aminoglycoside phosphotransferase (APT) family kinase protein